MAARLKPCDPDRLRLLAEDRLPAAEVAGLEEHLQHCAGCREALDEPGRRRALARGGPSLPRATIRPSPMRRARPRISTSRSASWHRPTGPTRWAGSGRMRSRA